MDAIVLNLIYLAVFCFFVYESAVLTPENHYSFITFFGKYHHTARSGLSFRVPFVTKVDRVVFLGLDSLAVPLVLKTLDQVTFRLTLKVQYVISNNVSEAFKAMYNITDYVEEMRNVTTNTAIPLANAIELEDVYNQKETITQQVEEDLRSFFSQYGITIKAVLSDEPILPKEIEDQANEVMKAKRQKESAQYLADSLKIEKVGAAEADGESVKIRMEKLGESRQAYATNAALSVKTLVDVGCSPDSALKFLNQIGEQDAIVSSSRNGSTMIFHTTDSQFSGSADALLAQSLIKENADNLAKHPMPSVAKEESDKTVWE